ncbi:MAG: hypothetical protein Q7V05_01520 [Methanoregula sp.]|nr:hypothetical protein [Methanoregula sp.]
MTSQTPVGTPFSSNVQVIRVADTMFVAIAGISGNPARASFTAAPGWNPVPVRSDVLIIAVLRQDAGVMGKKTGGLVGEDAAAPAMIQTRISTPVMRARAFV